jgi:S-(hydroxymethyl)glutathione dehydrogenase/alcohol dehydrogenase
VIEELELAEPRAREVRVRVDAVGVCHSDYHYMTGDLTCPLPIVLGHEGAAKVVAVGPGVTKVEPGDSVVLMWRTRCGSCRYCSTGRPAMCQEGRRAILSGGLLDGTSRLRRGGEEVKHFLGASCLAEECVVSEQSIVPISATIPPEVAAIAGCAVITGVGAVLNVLRNPAGNSVLVIGAGGVGLSAVMGARLVGADPIIVADLSAERLGLATELGATHTINAGEEDVVEGVRRIAGGVDWALEAIGLPRTVEQAVDALRPTGTAVIMGLAKADARFSVVSNSLVQGDKTIRGSLYGSANPPVDIPRILALYRSGRLPLDKLLGDTYPLEAVNEAYHALGTGAVGRSIVLPNAA